MFEVGWTEMLVIAIIMIVVVGPKDLPGMLRTFGRTVAKLRSMAGDFQKQFNEALKEAELEDVKKSVDALRGLNPASEIKKQLNPFEKAADEVRAGLNNALKPKPAAPSPDAVPAKGGDAEAPAAVLPQEAPAFPAIADPAVAAAPAPEKTAVAKKPAKRAAAKPAAVKPVPAQAAPAQAAPAKAASAKATSAKATSAKASPAASAKATKSAPKAAPVKVAKAAAEKKPAAARRKTAGAAK